MYSTITLPKSVINLYRFASKDEYRVGLQHVRIEYTEGSTVATAVATDGHRMAYLEFETGDVQPITGVVYIKANVLKAVKLGKDGVAVLREGCIVAMVKGVQTRHSAAYDLDGQGYPQWRQCAEAAPGDDDHAVNTIGVNARYLADFADYLKASGIKESITFKMPSDSMSAMRLTAADIEYPVIYVLMPCRV